MREPIATRPGLVLPAAKNALIFRAIPIDI
jgi:hypothetical protein